MYLKLSKLYIKKWAKINQNKVSNKKKQKLNLLLKKNEFKNTNSSMILTKRGLSEPKINKIDLQNIELGENNLGLTLNNNEEEISNLKGNNIDIKDINLNKNTIKIQNIQIENNINNNLSSNNFLNHKYL